MIKVYIEKKAVILRLESVDDDNVDIIVVDGAGKNIKNGTLARISLKGIHLWDFVNTNIGFDLDKSKRLKLI